MDVRTTEDFDRWIDRLRDRQARARILERVRRLAIGNPGDVAPVGDGVSELRIHYGPGYRIYFVQRGSALIVVVAGGNKDSQQTDIRRARTLAKEV
jgi:putative addiction module killer protein